MSSFISFEKASAMIQLYTRKRDVVIASEFQNDDIIAYSETFSAEDVKTVINQRGAVSLRIYYGMDEELQIHSILVAVDEDDNDMVELILEDAQRCPPICPVNSAFSQ